MGKRLTESISDESEPFDSSSEILVNVFQPRVKFLDFSTGHSPSLALSESGRELTSGVGSSLGSLMTNSWSMIGERRTAEARVLSCEHGIKSKRDVVQS